MDAEINVIDLLMNVKPVNLPEKEFNILRLSEECGKDVVFTLRALPYARVSDIRNVSEDAQAIHIILAGVVSPNLKDKALLERFGAVTPAELVPKMLLPGEIDDLALRIEQLSGYKTVVLDEVKKNLNPASTCE